jgi:hypothetical protein
MKTKILALAAVLGVTAMSAHAGIAFSVGLPLPVVTATPAVVAAPIVTAPVVTAPMVVAPAISVYPAVGVGYGWAPRYYHFGGYYGGGHFGGYGWHR